MKFISSLVDEYTCKRGLLVDYRSLGLCQQSEDMNNIRVNSVV